VLESTSAGTAAIGTISTGATLTGQVTLQRFVPNMTTPPIGGNGSWVALGTPILGASVANWNDDMVTTGFSGSDFPPPGYNFNNIQWYKESEPGAINLGYTGITNVSETISHKRGYFVYMYPNLLSSQNTPTVKGTIQQGSFNDTIFYTNTGNPTADGWNLLVNRYPSEIDFKSIAEAGSGGVTYYHLFDAETNNYKVYHTNATGNAPRYIASGQAFFVKANSSNTYLRYQEIFKSNQGTAFERNNEESSFAAIKFYKANNNSDECVLNFNNDATAAFEEAYDAVKLHSSEPNAAECALVGADGKRMTIDSRPLGQDASISIPVYVEMPTSGTYRLRIEQINNLPFGSCLHIEDLVTGNTMPFVEGQELVIVHTGNYSGNRFLIHASPSINTVETNLDCYGANNGSIELTVPQGEWTITLADTLGNTFNSAEGTMLFENLPAGDYVATASNALSNCPSSQKTIQITEPAEMVLTHLNSFVDNCNSSGNGSIEWTVSNATNYDYTVTNQANEVLHSGIGGSNAVVIDDLSSGVYTITINTYCGTQNFETSLVDSNTVSTQILSENVILALTEGETHLFTVEQSHTNATSFAWLLNGNLISQTEMLSYEFSQLGDYTLTLVAYNDNCSSQDSISIFVEMAVGITEEMKVTPVSFIQTAESIEMYLNTASSEMTTVGIYDTSGRCVWSNTTSTWSGKNISIGTGSFASGVYVICLRGICD